MKFQIQSLQPALPCNNSLLLVKNKNGFIFIFLSQTRLVLQNSTTSPRNTRRCHAFSQLFFPCRLSPPEAAEAVCTQPASLASGRNEV